MYLQGHLHKPPESVSPRVMMTLSGELLPCTYTIWEQTVSSHLITLLERTCTLMLHTLPGTRELQSTLRRAPGHGELHTPMQGRQFPSRSFRPAWRGKSLQGSQCSLNDGFPIYLSELNY